jgi:predicted RNase H-like HicB family nuclease
MFEVMQMDDQTRIYGYMFKVISQKAENSWVAFCPGVGGVYEEGHTQDEAISNAYSAACSVFEARAAKGDWLVEESEYLRVFRQPPNQMAIASLGPTEQEYLVTVPC